MLPLFTKIGLVENDRFGSLQIIRAFEVMAECPQHTFIVCTKRPERFEPVLYGREGNWYLGGGDYLPNVILMTTAENQPMADKRIPEILKCSPFKLAVSVEPTLGPVDLERWVVNYYGCRDCGEEYGSPDHIHCGRCGSANIINLSGVDWVVVGCETGPKRRPCNPSWIRSIKDQCAEAGVPLWVKKIDISPRLVETVEDLRIRQMPEVKV